MGRHRRRVPGGRCVGLYLGEGDVERLRELAEREGCGQSEVVRRLLRAASWEPALLELPGQTDLSWEIFLCSGADIDS